MMVDERQYVQATEPATPNQVAAVHGQFRRLGFGEADRDQRLAVSATILGLGGLGSTKDLTMGEAGQLYRTLLGVADRAGLAAMLRPAAAGQPVPRVTLVQVAQTLAAALASLRAAGILRPYDRPGASVTAGGTPGTGEQADASGVRDGRANRGGCAGGGRSDAGKLSCDSAWLAGA